MHVLIIKIHQMAYYFNLNWVKARSSAALELVNLLYTVVTTMKAVLKKLKGSEFLEEIEDEPVMESNPLARGRSRRWKFVVGRC